MNKATFAIKNIQQPFFQVINSSFNNKCVFYELEIYLMNLNLFSAEKKIHVSHSFL